MIGKPYVLPETGEVYVIVDIELLEEMVESNQDLTRVCTTCVEGNLWYVFVDNKTFKGTSSKLYVKY